MTNRTRSHRNYGTRGELHSTAPVAERAYLVAVEAKRRDGGISVEASLDELALLAHTAGADVVGRTVQRLDSPHVATYIFGLPYAVVRDNFAAYLAIFSLVMCVCSNEAVSMK